MSLEFAGTNNSYISIENDSDLQLGTGEFTVEWFQYRTDNHSYPRIFQFGNFPTTEFGVSIEEDTFYLWANSSWILNADIGEHKDQWIHFAITRDNTGRIRIFKNGTIVKSILYNDAINPTSTLYIGRQENSTNDNSSFGGYLTNFRYAKKAYYTSDFSTPISPLLNTADTSLLLLSYSLMVEFQDYSSKNKTINPNDVLQNTQTPFSTNVLSLTTNSSKSFLENVPEDELNPMSPIITKWVDFSYLNTEFKLNNTAIANGELNFTRTSSSVATQLTPQTRTLTNMTIYGWIKVIHTNIESDIFTILINTITNTYGIETRGDGQYRLRWNNKLVFIGQSTGLTIPNETDVFVALTVDTTSKVAKMYLKNNTINSNYTFSGPTFESDLEITPITLSNLMIGGNVNNLRYFNGSMKTLQMFNTVLSDAQIHEQYMLSGQQLGYVQYQTITPYKILLNYNEPAMGPPFPESFKTIFSNAATIVESMIIQSHGHREHPDYDMKVNITIEPLDAGIIGGSVITHYHIIDDPVKPDIPIEQEIIINSNGLDTRLSATKQLNGTTVPSLLSTFVHEILHGLGIASFTQEELISSTSDNQGDVGWEKYLDNSEVGQSWYVGPNPNIYTASKAIMAYREITGNPYIQRIPTENSFLEGTKHSHWEEGLTTDEDNNQIPERRYYNYTINNKTYGIFHPALPKEIMTGASNQSNYITKLTAGALEDYGYVVDYNSQYIVDYPQNEIQQPEEPVLVSLTSSQDWTAPQYLNSIEYAIIGGGGGGGGAYDRSGGGGGGAGLYITGSRRVIQSNPYKVVVGEGGAQTTFIRGTINEQNGNDGNRTSLGNVVAQGGEGGLASRISRNQIRGGGVAQNGNTRATSGTGGGGANGGGGGGGVLGNGGTTVTAGGAGGAGILNEWNNTVYGVGGSGGKIDQLINPSSATQNTGNGGNGASTTQTSNAKGGAGGSGIVLIRYVRGILNEEILGLNELLYEPLNEFEEQLDPSEPTQINFVNFINTQFTNNKVPNKQSLNTLKRALKDYNDRLDTNKGKVQANKFATLFTQVSSQVNLSTKELLAISSTPFQVTTLTPEELTEITTGNTLLYLMNEPNDVVPISIDGTIYEITITETGVSINSSNYTLDEQFTLGNYKFTVRFIGSIGLQGVFEDPEEPVTPLPKMEIETLTKKILNNRTNQSLFSLMNYSRNRILPQNNFLPTQTASNSDRLRKLKIQNHISANHR